MTDYTASTTAELIKDLGIANSGDRVLLVAGSYSNVNISNLAKTGVTITSADPDHKAVLNDLNVQNSSGISFTNLELVVTKNFGFGVYNSNNINLDHLDIHGSLDGNANDDAWAIRVKGCNNITMTNSHFHELTDAFDHLNCTNITISGNTFETIANNGVEGGGSSHVTISNNTFTNFQNIGWIVHPDAIQFWTTATTASASDITVDGNVIERGAGTPIQGIFFNDEVGTLPYQNVTITNNVVVGENYQGITVNHATNLTESGNLVLGTDAQPSYINMTSIDTANITDNIGTSLLDAGAAHLNASGNVLATTITDAQVASLVMPTTSVSAATNVASALANTAAWSVDALAAMPATASSSAAGDALAAVHLTGYFNGASTTGATYNFSVVQVQGTSGNDTLRSSAIGTSHLYGYDGNDNLFGSKTGLPGILEGGNGNDNYTIYNSADTIIENPTAAPTRSILTSTTRCRRTSNRCMR